MRAWMLKTIATIFVCIGSARRIHSFEGREVRAPSTSYVSRVYSRKEGDAADSLAVLVSFLLAPSPMARWQRTNTAAKLLVAMGLLPGNGLAPSQQTGTPGNDIRPAPTIARRLAAAGLLSAFIAGQAAAFENGIPEMAQYKMQAKYPGTQPELGLQRNGKLAFCDYEPHCFSTSGDQSHLLKLWRPKAGNDAMGELLEAIKSYPPFQARIDGGGFKIITATNDYLYVQFESLKRGFIDDVEFAINNDGGVQVRSSSRLGYLDLGVNAKRLNWISANLREKGWTASAITKDDYPEYFQLLTFTYDDYIRSVLSPETCPSPTDPLNCQDSM